VSRVSRGVDRVGVTFDDSTLVANAGLLVVATLSARLGIAEIADRLIGLAGPGGWCSPGSQDCRLVTKVCREMSRGFPATGVEELQRRASAPEH
jgi:hypothetical protein